MKYSIIGHDRNTAVLDMLIALLPNEKHELCNREDADCVSTLTMSQGFVAASVEICRNGIKTQGECVEPAPSEGEERKRRISYAVKTALFKAFFRI